jgi:hypothetical protein
MPENAINYDGPVDKIGTPEQIAEEVGLLLAQRSRWKAAGKREAVCAATVDAT